jgi:hypothetical protein
LVGVIHRPSPTFPTVSEVPMAPDAGFGVGKVDGLAGRIPFFSATAGEVRRAVTLTARMLVRCLIFQRTLADARGVSIPCDIWWFESSEILFLRLRGDF